ncbi:4-hydroxyphenylacetate decarboxylase activating enzyme [Pelotomaculum sp. FP]|uniref:glycyl-radical enzyme activating protein n=1 Tax=Pelotomaculum sp. FP TaxID=261474 RepID=UPI001064DA28|nr:glycyl-radical enzyme activating protein [Pelotomaculum sp. FP]TEB14125.1 4-hydroxyphenylacetate decarboxylase activating enzyme [Pelotomaculum sp. FP]
MKNDFGTEGIVFNIQRYTIHDGPGIRTEVFLKGCPLRCKWCSNPESMKPGLEVGVYANRCIGVDKCGYCLSACPQAKDRVIITADNKVTGIDREKCTNCNKCAESCPANALMTWGKKMTIPEVMKVVLADREFYWKSGGGVTLSGGEALVQWEFARELLKECKKNHLHTCLESALHCRTDILEQVYPYVDLALTDIKHMNSAKHMEFTGAGNELILKNIKKTVEMNKPLVIRIPVVPEHNNSEENIRAAAEFIVKELKTCVNQVQLLPYRQLGTEKYTSLGIDYPMGDFKPVERNVWEQNIRHLVEVMKSYGVPAEAGTTSKINL